MGISIAILFALPLFPNFRIKSAKFDILAQLAFWCFICDVILLGWLGAQPVEQPYIIIGQLAGILYFSYFLIIIPFLAIFEFKVLKY